MANTAFYFLILFAHVQLAIFFHRVGSFPNDLPESHTMKGDSLVNLKICRNSKFGCLCLLVFFLSLGSIFKSHVW